ncbi:putative GTP-binding controlling metal-binding domain-containing protein [Mortierella sp. GBAus27b]|nr:putative GTP-binding controlling metal-binding domain-containing protein [Mortierella sp. GBAus27b]
MRPWNTPGMEYRHYSPEAEVVLVEYMRPPETTQGPGPTTVSSTSSPSASPSPSPAAVSSTSSSLSSSLSSSSPASSPSTSTSPQYSLILKEIEKLRLEGKRRFGILRTSFTSPFTDTTIYNGSSTTSPTANNDDNGGRVNGSLSGDDSGSSCVIEFPLGQGSRPDNVARELFRGLWYLDRMNADCIFVEGISDQDEGLAVMNRVRKAASMTISLESTTFL